MNNSKPILIHTHFHKRRTGVTRSIENVFPFFVNHFESYIYGYGIKGKKLSNKALISFLFSNRQIVVHCHRNNEILKMLFFRFLGGKFKLISTRHAETVPSKLTKYLLSKSDKVITLIQSMSNTLEIENTVVGHGVNVAYFTPKPKSTLKDIPQENIILCAGRVRKAKGQETLITAVSPLLQQTNNWALVIVGKVDKIAFLDELKEITKTHQVEDKVYFINETLEIVKYYQASHTVIVPSFSEGFSLVTAEAMSCGCNVVATKNVGVHSSIIINEKNGYLFDAGNVEDLKSVLLDIIENKKPHLGKEARKEIVKNWSAKEEAEKLMQVYKT